MSSEMAAGGEPVVNERAVSALSHVAGLTLWLYWAGIVGGLVTSVVGGWLGARSEGRAPRRIGVRVPVAPAIPQPA
jgi:hypothetical protein